VLIAGSCSKIFGVCRLPVGLWPAVAQDASRRVLNRGMVRYLGWKIHAFPPDQGARLVSIKLNDPMLRAAWEARVTDA